MGLTPTQLAARERHLKFKQSIERKASELAAAKMVAVMKEEVRSLEPADIDPPAPQGMHWFRPSDASEGLSIRDYPSIPAIQKAICDYFGITRHVLLSWRKTPEIVRPRQIGYYLCTELTPFSLKQIGQRFGRDHSSVLHSSRLIKKKLLEDSVLAFDVAHLIEAITGEQK
jgi:hypothetical protein